MSDNETAATFTDEELDAEAKRIADDEATLKARRAAVRAQFEARKARDLAILTPYLDENTALNEAYDESEELAEVKKIDLLAIAAKDALNGLKKARDDERDTLVATCREEHGDRHADLLKNTIEGKSGVKRAPKANGGNGIGSGNGAKTTGIEESAGFVSPCGNVVLDGEGMPTVNGARVTWNKACESLTNLCGMKAAEDSDHKKDEGKTGLSVAGNSGKRQFEAYIRAATK